MRVLSTLACLALPLVAAVDIRGFWQANEVCTNVQDLQDSIVELDGGLRTALFRRTGDFVFRDVDPGLYIISISAQHFMFDQYMVEVVSPDRTPLVYPYVPGTPLLPKPNVTYAHPFAVLAKRRNNYFVPAESFNVLGMFQSPMMLLMLGSGVMMFAMPWLMSNMDPEAVEDAKKMQAKIFGAQAAIQNGDLAGAFKRVAGEEQAGSPAPAAGQQSAKQRTPLKKKR